jgi:hypothetical protein
MCFVTENYKQAKTFLEPLNREFADTLLHEVSPYNCGVNDDEPDKNTEIL